MASPPQYASSPTAMSPPYPTPASIPNKKRSSSFDTAGKPPAMKRRKASTLSQSSVPVHPLRQTSFPPEARSPHTRSPSVDALSHVSGSAVSGTASGVGGAAARKKRGRKLARGAGKTGDDGGANDQASSVAGGKAATNVSGQGVDKDAEEDEDDDKAEMALEDVVARTQEQKQEEIRLRAMLVEAFDSEQYNRYELWRAAKLSDAVVKRVSITNYTIVFSWQSLTRLGCQCYSVAVCPANGQHRRQGRGQALCGRAHRGGAPGAGGMDPGGRAPKRAADAAAAGRQH